MYRNSLSGILILRQVKVISFIHRRTGTLSRTIWKRTSMIIFRFFEWHGNRNSSYWIVSTTNLFQLVSLGSSDANRCMKVFTVCLLLRLPHHRRSICTCASMDIIKLGFSGVSVHSGISLLMSSVHTYYHHECTFGQ